MKSKTFLTLDTETVGLKPLNYIYDIAWSIHNKRGEVVAERSYMVRDIATDADKMMGAYFAKKVFSFYLPALDSGKIRLTDWRDIAAKMSSDIIAYNVDVIAAYNARFDMGAMRATNHLLEGAPIVPRKTDVLCIWNFACSALLNRPTYKRLARDKGWISEADNIRTTAEHTYRYISGNHDFIEAHTALEDVRIETEILARCFAQKKPIPYNQLNNMPWRIPQGSPDQRPLT